MADLSINVRMPKMDEIDGKKAMAVLRSHASEIAAEIEQQIEDRTPVDTGALKEDETYEVNRGGNELVHWYVGDAYQLAENKRVYSAYQEGPPLGLSTYTNDPHQMYFKVTTDDLPLITDWAQRMVEQAAEQMAEMAEAGATTWEMP
jgi:hypothetical protein